MPFPLRRERNGRRVVKFKDRGEAVKAFTAMADAKTIQSAGSARPAHEGKEERAAVHDEAARLGSTMTRSKERNKGHLLADRGERYSMAAKNVENKGGQW